MRNVADKSPSTNTAAAKTKGFWVNQVARSAPVRAPSAVATTRSTEIKRVAPRVDCMTTSVAIAAQYASGKPKRRATAREIVAAMAVRTECLTDGRFSGSHFQSFTRAIFRIRPESATPIWRWTRYRSLGSRATCILTNLHELPRSLYQFTTCESAK
jgi:hypothetical protein